MPGCIMTEKEGEGEREQSKFTIIKNSKKEPTTKNMKK